MKTQPKHRPNTRHQGLLLALVIGVIILIIGTDRLTHNGSAPLSRPTHPLGTAEIMHGDTTTKEIIFTFDGGDGIQSADEILRVLAVHHVRGTFFLTGKMIESHPDLVKRIAAAGHEIFNHTDDHTDLTTLSSDRVAAELAGMEQKLQRLTGASSKPYFRAPYGARNPAVLAAAHAAGYQSVYWTVDALDWKEPTGETATQVRDRILSHITPGTIFLMHLGDTITGAVLDDVFTTIEARGYRIVSLTQGL